MPLANVLSALRILILDGEASKLTSVSREQYLSSRLPQLTAEELADLIKIPADKLAIYTRSIFAGEGQLLQRKLPATWALLREIWPSCFGESINHIAVARKLHQFKPWDSRKTESLVQHYTEFIRKCILPGSGKWQPLLFDTLQFELATFWLYRSPEVPDLGQNQKNLTALEEITVEELLSLSCALSKNVAFLALQHRFVPGAANLSQRVTSENFKLEPQYLVGARAADNHVTWLELTLPVFQKLRSIHPRGNVQIAELAQVFLADERSFESETAQFKEFMQFFAELISIGFISQLPSTLIDAGNATMPCEQ